MCSTSPMTTIERTLPWRSRVILPSLGVDMTRVFLERSRSYNALARSKLTRYQVTRRLHIHSQCYFTACCTKDIKQLELLFRVYPEDSFANAFDREGNNGILLAATEDAGLDTIKWLKQKGVSVNQKNYYGRTALMEAALWGRNETV
jgi:ankyrin repeat protein